MNKRLVVLRIVLFIVIAISAFAVYHFVFSKPDIHEKPPKEPVSEQNLDEDKAETDNKQEETPEDNQSTSSQKPSEETLQHTSNGMNIVSNPNDVTVLLNKKNALPDGWAPPDLTYINSNTGAENYLRSEAAAAWEKLRIAALNDGIQINVVSSYRTEQYQRDLYNYYMSFDAENAPYYSAYPRTSEHEMGLAIDISYDLSLHDDLQNSEGGRWMNEHGWKYGWIMRYPQGKESITGYIFEPWHYRYVGVDLASKLHRSGLTMEEYFS